MKTSDFSYMQNRELSWLRFNERVLDEAGDERVPLLERLKFASIFSSNLDEFFMIRVGSLFDLSSIDETAVDNKTGWTPKQQLSAIFRQVTELCEKRDDIYEQLEARLREYDISNLKMKELEKPEKKFITQYYEDYIEPVLSPQIIDTHHPFPHLENKKKNIASILSDAKGKTMLGIISIPHILPEIVYLPGNSVRYILIEEIIAEKAPEIFNIYKLESKAVISVTRNADISPDDEAYEIDEDYRNHMKKMLKKRDRLAPVRLEVYGEIDKSLLSLLCKRINLKEHQIFQGTTPITMGYAFSIAERLPPAAARSLTYEPFTPQLPSFIKKEETITKQVQRKDILLSYPYEQISPFLRLLKESANDPNVLSIKITIYRLASSSKIIEHLCTASENGKDVTVLMELRARFDERNNIDWSERLDESGCRVIYGFDEFKVHSKICLITRRDKGKINYITQIGTGNYNEKTSKLYTDLSLITANEAIGTDAAEFFKNMLISNLYGTYEHLLIAPVSLKDGLISLIDGEIEKAKNGGEGRIIIKANSVTERTLITKLSEASIAGVEVKLIIRGICCILPEVENKTEHVSVISIVGRFLEHSRIYCFGTGNDTNLYISSADIMTRNISRRVEIACPIYDHDVKQKIMHILDCCLKDNVKARKLKKSGKYKYIAPPETASFDCQKFFIEEAQQTAYVENERKVSWIQRFKNKFKK